MDKIFGSYPLCEPGLKTAFGKQPPGFQSVKIVKQIFLTQSLKIVAMVLQLKMDQKFYQNKMSLKIIILILPHIQKNLTLKKEQKFILKNLRVKI